MKIKTIMFDIDGVLTRGFIAGFKGIAKSLGKDPETVEIGTGPPPDDVDLATHMAAKIGDMDVWRVIIDSLNFWEEFDTSCTFQEWERIYQLEDLGHRLYFVTNRVGRLVKNQTEAWLKHMGIPHPTVIISAKKGECAVAFGADYAIDDKAGNAVYTSWQSPRTKSYLLDTPKNQFDPGVLGSRVIRVKTVMEFLEAVEGK